MTLAMQHDNTMKQDEYDKIHAELDQMESDIRKMIDEDLEKSKEMIAYFVSMVSLNYKNLEK